MAEFSIQEAALTGFRVVREHPRSLGIWAIYLIAVSFLLTMIAVGVSGPDLANFLTLAAHPGQDPALVLAAVSRLAPVSSILLPVTFVSNAVVVTAVMRAAFNGPGENLGYLRVGADELRQLGLALLTLLVFLAAYIGLAFGLGLAVALVSAAGQPPAPVVVAISLIGVLAGMAYLGVRLSLAPVLTFETRRINLFGSWALTKGRFWPLAATYGLTLLLILVVHLLSTLFIFAIDAVLGGGDPVARAPDLASLAIYLTPRRILEIALSACESALVLPVWLMAPVAVYQRVAPSGVAAIFA